MPLGKDTYEKEITINESEEIVRFCTRNPNFKYTSIRNPIQFFGVTYFFTVLRKVKKRLFLYVPCRKLLFIATDHALFIRTEVYVGFLCVFKTCTAQ